MGKQLVTVPLGLLAIVLVGASWGQPGRKHAHKPPPCSLRGSRTLYRDTAVRVYEKFFRPDFITKDYACLLAANKRRRLLLSYDDSTGEYLGQLMVHAPRVAYWHYSHEKGTDIVVSSEVCIFNLRRRTPRCASAADSVDGLGLTPAGSMAWMDSFYDPDYPPPKPVYSVRKLNAGAKDPVVLDSGKDIDPTSFAVGGRYVYWTKAGKPQSATMP